MIMLQATQSVPLGGGETDTTGFMIALSHAQAREINRIDLDVPGVTAPSVTRRGHKVSIDRLNPTAGNKEYFKWIIDLENNELHDGKLTLIPGVLKPVMHINVGEFYTEAQSEVAYKRIKGNTKRAQFGTVAALIGMRVDTLPQGKAYLRMGDTTIPLVTKEGATCELRIMNHRPISDEHKQVLGQIHLSDFAFYYHAFRVDVLERFDFNYEKPKEHGFPPAVCYGGGGSQTPNLDQ
jgi:hypothetical protein